MTAEIIAIGSELLTPQRVDTNSLFLTDQVNGLGVEVVTKSVVGDDLDRLADAVRRAVSRSEIVVLCGGLGPTEDDLTRDAVAAALDRKLIYHPEIAEVLEQRFAQLKRKMVEVNKRQAFLVEGAEMLPNDRGTAPGQWIEDSGSYAMLLPGPAHEMKAMFTRQCLPRLARIVPRQAIRTLVLRVIGMPESPASSAGAVQAAVAAAWGRIPLVLLVAGLAAYALTQLLEAVFRAARATSTMGRWRQRAVSSWGFLLYSV